MSPARPTRRQGLRAAAAMVAAAGLTLTIAPGALADDPDVRNLPAITDRMLQESVAPIDLNASDLDLNVHDLDLEGSVRDFEVETAEGDTTVVALSSDVLFAFGRAEVSDAAGARIKELVAEIPKGATVTIGGHTDNIGSDGANQKLSEERAEAVAEIVKKERSDLKLEVTGYGEKEPVASNGTPDKDDPVGRSKNRRVEIRYDG